MNEEIDLMSTRPRRLGKYELQERLGLGGMAEVWKALDTQLQRYVAIKLLHANLKEDPHFIARFEREAQLIASLHHPNIVQIHDFQIASSEEEGTIAYMVMDYVEGQTLADYIRRTSGLGNVPSPPEIVQLFTSIGLAVDYAHQQGMIHRDLKPANILLDKHNTTRNYMGEPILTDFGLARLLKSPAITLTAVQLGTPFYIAPEQVTGNAGTERSDIYSLGVILYEMVTGTPPFQGDNPTAVMTQHLNTAPPSPALPVTKTPTPATPPPALMAQSGSSSALKSSHLPPSQPYPTATSGGQVTPALSSGGITGSGSSAPAQSPPMTTPPMFAPTPPSPAKHHRGLLFGLIALIIVLLGGSLGGYFLFLHPGRGTPLPGPRVGHAFYGSSGQL